jgi:hypothetical protein
MICYNNASLSTNKVKIYNITSLSVFFSLPPLSARPFFAHEQLHMCTYNILYYPHLYAHIWLRDTLGIPASKGRIRSVMGREAICSVGMLSSLLIAVAILGITTLRATLRITTLGITTLGIATLGSTGYTPCGLHTRYQSQFDCL